MVTDAKITVIRPRSCGGVELQVELTANRRTLEVVARDFAQTVGLTATIQGRSAPGDYPIWVDFEIGTGQRFTTFFKPE